MYTHQVRKKRDKEKRQTGTLTDRLTPEQKLFAIIAYSEPVGLKVEYICTVIGISRGSLHKVLKPYGVTMRPNAKPLLKNPSGRTLYYREYDRNRRARAIARELGYNT